MSTLTEAKLKQMIVEVLNEVRGIKEAKLNPTFFLDTERRRTLYDRIIADPNVDPRIKDILQNNDGPFFEQGLELLKATNPEYASELDHYDSHQGSLNYQYEFRNFYNDAKRRLANEDEE